MRSLFVGDSMTIGRASDWIWRHRTWRHLEAVLPRGYEIVGPRSGLHVWRGRPGRPAGVRRSRVPGHRPPAPRRVGEGCLHMPYRAGEAVAA
ncbi:hypothetical protein ACLB9X_25085 [Streptomyces sp. 5K101]|uniref:hypothetical protein n=1 Tax=Streptomyces sp. 5K101 TaxID=3390037 RepID=UPI0039748276